MIIISIKELLNSQILNNTETAVSLLTNSGIDDEDIEWIEQRYEKIIKESQISIQEISTFINFYSHKIIAFASFFLKESDPGKLCKGFSITYAIYIIYLKNSQTKNLKDFLNRQRIPNPLKWYKLIKDSYNNIHH